MDEYIRLENEYNEFKESSRIRYEELEHERKIREDYFRRETEKSTKAWTQKLEVAMKNNNNESKAEDNIGKFKFDILSNIQGFEWTKDCKISEDIVLEKMLSQIKD